MNTSDSDAPLRTVAGLVAGDRHPQAKFLVAGFRQANTWMDPFLSIDHFRMDEPTFRPHPHAGFSAVTVVFEDSPGTFRNRDTLGSDLELKVGDIHWTLAGSGIQHEEVPTQPGLACHGAQVFVALPVELEISDPRILHAGKADVSVVTSPSGAVARVLAGELDGKRGLDPGHDVTLLDVTVPAGSGFGINPGDQRTCFVVAINGHGFVNSELLAENYAIGFEPQRGVVNIEARDTPFHVLVAGGTPLRRESHWFVGIAMSTPERSADADERFRRGEFGTLKPSF